MLTCLCRCCSHDYLAVLVPNGVIGVISRCVLPRDLRIGRLQSLCLDSGPRAYPDEGVYELVSLGLPSSHSWAGALHASVVVALLLLVAGWFHSPTAYNALNTLNARMILPPPVCWAKWWNDPFVALSRDWNGRCLLSYGRSVDPSSSLIGSTCYLTCHLESSNPCATFEQ